jgi:hypothetical protein
MIVINDVVGQKLRKTSNGLFGSAKTSAVKKIGNVKSKLMTPEICCPS